MHVVYDGLLLHHLCMGDKSVEEIIEGWGFYFNFIILYCIFFFGNVKSEW